MFKQNVEFLHCECVKYIGIMYSYIYKTITIGLYAQWDA